MFKRLFVTISLLLIISGCSAQSKTPEDAVEKYFKAVSSLNVVQMEQSFVEREEIEVGEVELEDLKEMKAYFDFFKENLALIEYEIIDGTESESSATVQVQVKYVNGAGVFQSVISEAMTKMFELAFQGEEVTEEMSEQFVKEAFANAATDFKVEFAEDVVIIPLVKVGNEWLIEEMTNELLNVSFMGIYDLGLMLEGME